MDLKLLVAAASDFHTSIRWQHPDSPGSAHVEELGARLHDPAAYRAFRETPEGDYLLSLIEAYEAALNDDWLPLEVVGLSHGAAREFIGCVALELERQLPLSQIVGHLRGMYERLSRP
jgi:hypothetical protein